jgi:phosphatidylinositol alpha-1,6-mannosyltransferase
MKTLVTSPEIFASEGGISRIMRLYIKALDEHDVDGQIDVVALVDPQGNTSRMEALDLRSGWGYFACGRRRLRFCWEVLRGSRGADRVICGHINQLPSVAFARLFRPQMKCYLVAHGIEVWRPYSWLQRWALRQTDMIFCVSDYTRRQIQRFLPDLAKCRFRLLPNTFDPKLSSRGAGGPSPATDAGPTVLVVSRLSRDDSYKGVDCMIEAMPGILAEFPHATLRIVGGGNDRGRLELLAQHLGVKERVLFLGLVDDAILQTEYKTCNFFALPSAREGFGLVYLEAMSHGKSCLVARAGGAPEVVDESVGAVIDYGNIDQIVWALCDLVRNPRSVRAIKSRLDYYSYAEFSIRLKQLLAKESQL